MNEVFQPSRPKEDGAYYTPDPVVRSLVSWAVRDETDVMLDPSCGDGRFLMGHVNSVGVEQDPEAAAVAKARAPGALVHQGDFFRWAGSTEARYECAAGNPPFIRYQRFKGDVRQRALTLAADLGAEFSGLTSSWAPFLVVAGSLIKPGGRMAFVIPAEVGHAPYAAPLVEWLVSHFANVQLVAVREKVFPALSEDTWLLYAEGKGGRTEHVALTVLERFSSSNAPPRPTINVPVADWRTTWNRRLRPFLLPASLRQLYRDAVDHPDTVRLGSFADVGIGYVSGANDFFHLRPSEVAQWGIPTKLLQPAIRNSRALPGAILSKSAISALKKNDDQFLLLKLDKGTDLPDAVRRYLDTEAAEKAQTAYKCRTRDPWYSVPDVKTPDFFLTYMSGRNVSLVRNDAEATCTNALHCVQVRDQAMLPSLLATQASPFFQLTSEIEGHPLGGGMLKLEPREAARIAVPSTDTLASLDHELVTEAVAETQKWRHYGA